MTVKDVLREEHKALRKAVPGKRRKADVEEGPLAQTFREAMRLWDAQKAQGVTFAERQAGLAKSLKAAWPQVREWKYLCNRCDDTGWEPGICTPQTPCGRPFKLPGQHSDDYTGQGRCSPGHTYVTPCWCEKGQGMRRQLMKQPKPMAAGDFQQAAKTKPTKVGR